MKVSVVSVVGAFRSGKSFLLNFFLRYLVNGKGEDLSDGWMVVGGSEQKQKLKGNMNKGFEDEVEGSFAWRGGEDRQTTGMWMWSEPLIRATLKSNGEPMAILLMDTQGMFDGETCMALTAQIFGLSTFVSSFQIYNVGSRLQEDNFQHLALFSEYGRLALEQEKRGSNRPIDAAPSATTTTTTTHGPAEEAPALAPEGDVSAPAPAPKQAVDAAIISSEPPAAPAAAAPVEPPPASAETTHSAAPPPPTAVRTRPFQRIQFLVRDWPDFHSDFDGGDVPVSDRTPEEQDEFYLRLHAEMDSYTAKWMHKDQFEELQSTRAQIKRCFQDVACFLLPHPGLNVQKRTFDGSLDKIEPFFLFLVNRFVRLIFDNELEFKNINGRDVTAPDLLTYFKVYTAAFANCDDDAEGAGAGGESAGGGGRRPRFPRAMTMLDATAEANNRIAHQEGADHYKRTMGKSVGDESSYVQEPVLEETSRHAEREALGRFDEIANIGSEEAAHSHRARLVADIASERKRYFDTNSLRNPYRDVEKYVLPVVVALTAWLIATLFDLWCLSDTCEYVESAFKRVYMFVGFGLLIYSTRSSFKDATLLGPPIAAALVAWVVAFVINSSCATETCVKAGDAFERIYFFVFYFFGILFFKNFKTFQDMLPMVMKFASQGASAVSSAAAKKEN